MKILYLFLLLFLAACNTSSRITYRKYNSGFSVCTGDSAVPVMNGEKYPHCNDRETVDWWQIDSIYETGVVLKRAASYRLDSLDYYERRAMKKFDKPAYNSLKNRLIAINYTDNMSYFVYLVPDSIVYRNAGLDSISAWVLPQRYTECINPIRRRWIDYWALKPINQPFLFPTEGLHRKVELRGTKN